jgi:hypothetical protein
VISFPEAEKPPLWAFEDFVYPNGSNPVEAWYSSQSEAVQDAVDAMLKDMRKTSNHINWGAWRGFLRGEAKRYRIWEVGVKAEGRQYRLFGIFGGKKIVILLVGCYHKANVYAPHDAIETAIKRAKALNEGNANTNARQIRSDF